MIGDVDDLDRVAQVGLVVAVFQHRFAVRNARERIGRYRAAISEFLENAVQHGFDRVEHVVLRDKAHFEIELVEFARRTISARVFVAEAGRDLEIAIETGNHQQLLEHLRRLRQRVELARMDAAGHQIVARAFGARRGQDRRLEFGEALIDHPATNRRNHLRTQHDIVVQSLATQVEIAVTQANILRVFGIAEHGERQFGRRRLHRHLAGAQFDVAGGQVGVGRLAGAGDDFAGNRDHGFGAGTVDRLERFRVDIGNDLGDAEMIAQIDEQQAAMIALPMNPAGEANGFSDVRSAQFRAIVRAIGVHEALLFCSAWQASL